MAKLVKTIKNPDGSITRTYELSSEATKFYRTLGKESKKPQSYGSYVKNVSKKMGWDNNRNQKSQSRTKDIYNRYK